MTKCKHLGEIEIIEPNWGLVYDPDTGEYHNIADEDIPMRCHIDGTCLECFKTVRVQITAKLVHQEEETE